MKAIKIIEQMTEINEFYYTSADENKPAISYNRILNIATKGARTYKATDKILYRLFGDVEVVYIMILPRNVIYMSEGTEQCGI